MISSQGETGMILLQIKLERHSFLKARTALHEL
jgi:hypothetical protein